MQTTAVCATMPADRQTAPGARTTKTGWQPMNNKCRREQPWHPWQEQCRKQELVCRGQEQPRRQHCYCWSYLYWYPDHRYHDYCVWTTQCLVWLRCYMFKIYIAELNIIHNAVQHTRTQHTLEMVKPGRVTHIITITTTYYNNPNKLTTVIHLLLLNSINPLCV